MVLQNESDKDINLGHRCYMEKTNKTALLLINTGSPDAATVEAVRRYLAEFLGDRRIVELPRWKWWPILHGIILRTRPKKSAERYKSIWTDEGAPLIVHTKRTASALEAELGIPVYWSMRYGSPSTASVLDAMRADGIDRVLVMPMFAQYASQTTAACLDGISEYQLSHVDAPAVRTIHDYHDDPAYIDALATHVRAYWDRHGAPVSMGGRLVMSFHGIPKASSDRGDVYEAQCRRTAELLAQRLGLERGQWCLCFQSRFGRDEWLRPYTVDSVRELGAAGVTRVDVVCPGFAADCLETIEEIDDELRREYLSAFRGGGQPEFHYIDALNESPEAVKAYATIVRREAAGWL